MAIEVTVFAVSSLVTFAGAAIAGLALWQAILFAPLAGALTVTATVVYGAIAGSHRRTVTSSNRLSIVAHMVLGLAVLLAADVLTMLFVADGVLTTTPAIVVLGGLWIEGLALLLAGVLVFRGATRAVRPVAIVGLGIAVVWGLLAVVSLEGVVLRLVADGFADTVGSRRDAVESLAIVVIVVVLPALVFIRDLRGRWGRGSSDNGVGPFEER